MKHDLTLWGAGTPRTHRAHWVLAEASLAYESRPILPRSGETRSDEFLAVNPAAKIPALVHGEHVIAESAAIVNYVAETLAPNLGLAPPPGTIERGHYDQWCFFLMTELDATALYIVRRHKGLPEIYGDAPAAVEGAVRYAERQIGVIESHLEDGRSFLLGDRFTGADILLGSCLGWVRSVGLEPGEHLGAYEERVTSRPAHQRAASINYSPAVMNEMR